MFSCFICYVNEFTEIRIERIQMEAPEEFTAVDIANRPTTHLLVLVQNNEFFLLIDCESKA